MGNRKKRLEFQKKPAKKGHKSMRGVPEIYDEKKVMTSICLTPTGRKGIDLISQELSLSRSELIERIGRGVIKLRINK